jgi:hypothetical protein
MPLLRPPKRFLSAEQKHEILLKSYQRADHNQAATRAGAGRSKIMTLRQVARAAPCGVAGVASGDVRTRFEAAEESVERSRRFQRAP